MLLSEKIFRLANHFTRHEPEILAFVPEEDRFKRLYQEAKILEERYPDPAHRPPLFGVFLGVKDIFHAAGFPTRAGSALPPDELTGPEGDAVARLKAAGALIAGKTVTTQFAYFAPGPTHNPHNLAHTPGGSSSGSAAAVAAGLCEIALGTQTIGSINRPAAFCGVVGFKPSYDRIPRTGVIPLSPSVDHVGVFGTTVQQVEDAARVLCDSWHPTEVELPQPILGIPDGPYLARAESEGQTHFYATVASLEKAGFEIRHIPVMPDFETLYQAHNAIVAYDAARVHTAWYAAYPALYHPKTIELLERGWKIPAEEYETALASRFHLRATLAEQMTAHGIHLWLSPSAPGPAPRGLESTGNPVMNLPWTHAGLPTLTLPAGKNPDGLPLGLQVTAGWYQDEKLLHWAKALEKARQGVKT